MMMAATLVNMAARRGLSGVAVAAGALAASVPPHRAHVLLMTGEARALRGARALERRPGRRAA